MGRFYKTDKSKTIDWAYKGPYEAMFKIAEIKANNKAMASGITTIFDDQLDFQTFASENWQEQANKVKDYYGQKVDDLTKTILETGTISTENQQKLISLQRELHKDYTSGRIANLQNPYLQTEKSYAELKEASDYQRTRGNQWYNDQMASASNAKYDPKSQKFDYTISGYVPTFDVDEFTKEYFPSKDLKKIVEGYGNPTYDKVGNLTGFDNKLFSTGIPHKYFMEKHSLENYNQVAIADAIGTSLLENEDYVADLRYRFKTEGKKGEEFGGMEGFAVRAALRAGSIQALKYLGEKHSRSRTIITDTFNQSIETDNNKQNLMANIDAANIQTALDADIEDIDASYDMNKKNIDIGYDAEIKKAGSNPQKLRDAEINKEAKLQMLETKSDAARGKAERKAKGNMQKLQNKHGTGIGSGMGDVEDNEFEFLSYTTPAKFQSTAEGIDEYKEYEEGLSGETSELLVDYKDRMVEVASKKHQKEIKKEYGEAAIEDFDEFQTYANKEENYKTKMTPSGGFNPSVITSETIANKYRNYKNWHERKKKTKILEETDFNLLQTGYSTAVAKILSEVPTTVIKKDMINYQTLSSEDKEYFTDIAFKDAEIKKIDGTDVGILKFKKNSDKSKKTFTPLGLQTLLQNNPEYIANNSGIELLADNTAKFLFYPSEKFYNDYSVDKKTLPEGKPIVIQSSIFVPEQHSEVIDKMLNSKTSSIREMGLRASNMPYNAAVTKLQNVIRGGINLATVKLPVPDNKESTINVYPMEDKYSRTYIKLEESELDKLSPNLRVKIGNEVALRVGLRERVITREEVGELHKSLYITDELLKLEQQLMKMKRGLSDDQKALRETSQNVIDAFATKLQDSEVVSDYPVEDYHFSIKEISKLLYVK